MFGESECTIINAMFKLHLQNKTGIPRNRSFSVCLLHVLYLLIFRYLKSIVETILIYKHFVKLPVEQPVAKQELVDFWMDFLVEATKTHVTVVRFPVSIASFNSSL